MARSRFVMLATRERFVPPERERNVPIRNGLRIDAATRAFGDGTGVVESEHPPGDAVIDTPPNALPAGIESPRNHIAARASGATARHVDRYARLMGE